MNQYKFPFRDLVCYQKGKDIVMEIYKVVKALPIEERYALSDQLRRAAISITSNIAEGAGRMFIREQIHFIEISFGSLMEVLSQLEIALTLGYIDNVQFNKIEDMIAEESRIISGFRLSLIKQLHKQADEK